MKNLVAGFWPRAKDVPPEALYVRKLALFAEPFVEEIVILAETEGFLKVRFKMSGSVQWIAKAHDAYHIEQMCVYENDQRGQAGRIKGGLTERHIVNPLELADSQTSPVVVERRDGQLELPF